jgi:hypothetical protein
MWVQVEDGTRWAWMERMREKGIRFEVWIEGRYMLIWLSAQQRRKASSFRSTDARSSLDGIERKSLHETWQESHTYAAAAPTNVWKEDNTHIE